MVHESARKYQPPTWSATNLREPRDGFRTHAELRAELCKRRKVAFFQRNLAKSRIVVKYNKKSSDITQFISSHGIYNYQYIPIFLYYRISSIRRFKLRYLKYFNLDLTLIVSNHKIYNYQYNLTFPHTIEVLYYREKREYSNLNSNFDSIQDFENQLRF